MSNQTVVVRSAFVARPGYYFLDPDYNQIEFRLSAAMAGEERVLKGFASGHDYYTLAYNGMFNTNFTGLKDPNTGKRDISDEDRKLGKETALGQNYDQSAMGLARKLKVSPERGQEFYDRYWEGQPATKLAKERQLQFARQKGYVTTWFGRKRSLPELYSDIRNVRAKAERSVWNTVVQGTAADWLKIAMVRVAEALKGYDVHILLTVHDELLFEVSEKEPVYEVWKIIKDAMEFKVKGLPVGLEEMYPDGFYVGIGDDAGYDWGNLSPLEKFIKKHGHRLNLSPVRPEFVPKFLPEKAPMVVPVIPERVSNVAPQRDTYDDGVHPLDAMAAILDAGCKTSDEAMKVATSLRLGQHELPIPIAKDVMKGGNMPDFTSTVPEPVVEEIHLDGDMSVSMDEALKRIPPPPGSTHAPKPPLEVVTIIDPVIPAPVTELPRQMTLDAPVVLETTQPRKIMKTSSDKDFKYPAALVKLGDTMDQKQLNFLKALLSKFPGKYQTYLDFQGKCIHLEGKSIDPGPLFVNYLTRGLPKAEVEILE